MSRVDHFRARSHTDSKGCLRWSGCLNHAGYAKATVEGRSWLVHRYMYEHTVGAIPEGLVLDHLCRTRDCINPDHLEPVTRGENVMRGETIPASQAARSECKRGHPYDKRNSYRYRGARVCRECVKIRARTPNTKPRLTDNEVVDVTKRARAGERPEGLAEEHGVSSSLVYMWRRGEGRAARLCPAR